jgi:oxygen-independent coproporphyrinogen III oxidase
MIHFSGYSPGIYIHYPYCIQKCDYCDFYSEGIGFQKPPDEELLYDAYIREFEFRILSNEILLKQKFNSFFIGGGTPSKMNLKTLNRLIDFVKLKFKWETDSEFSIEANPEDLNDLYLENLYQAGINRINVGIQSFNPIVVEELGRYYRKEIYNQTMEILSKSRIPKKGIDLIYGVPNQSVEDFEKDIEKAIEYPINHLSCYSLTVEKGTSYSRKISEGKKSIPIEDIQVEILKNLPEILLNKGFQQYEVSNYSKRNFESIHNLKYWKMEKFIGIGPGASGYTDHGRYSNPRNTKSYLSGNWGKEKLNGMDVEDLTLNLFRIFLPIDLISFETNFHVEYSRDLISNWVKKKLCAFDLKTGIFQWYKESIFFLDDFIFELIETAKYNK